MIAFFLFVSCTSGKRPNSKINEFVQMNQVWKLKPDQQNVIESFGTHFEKVQDGVVYKYEKTLFTKMAFFFGPDDKLNAQFAIVDEVTLKIFKKDVSCDWNEKKIGVRKPHIVIIVESGQCLKHMVKYFYREELGSYEIRWL